MTVHRIAPWAFSGSRLCNWHCSGMIVLSVFIQGETPDAHRIQMHVLTEPQRGLLRIKHNCFESPLEQWPAALVAGD